MGYILLKSIEKICLFPKQAILEKVHSSPFLSLGKFVFLRYWMDDFNTFSNVEKSFWLVCIHCFLSKEI